MKMASKDQNNRRKKPKKLFFRGLGKTLLIAFLALALIPVTVVSIISYRNAYRSIQNVAAKALSSVTNLKTAQIDAYFDKISADLNQQSKKLYNRQIVL